MKKLPIIIHLISILFVIPMYLIGLLFHISGTTFLSIGYLLQFDIEEAAEAWIYMYDRVKNIRY